MDQLHAERQGNRLDCWKHIFLLEERFACCGTDQNEFFMSKHDAFGGQKATHREKNMARRRRNFTIRTEGRTNTLQLNIKMMNFNKTRRRKGTAWPRGEQQIAGSSNSGSDKICMKEEVDLNGPQNSGVRDILLQFNQQWYKIKGSTKPKYSINHT